MHTGGLKLSRRHRAWLYGTMIALFVTGMAWWWLHDFGTVETEFGPRSNPLEGWSLKLHGLAAMLSLVVLGTLIPLHIRRGWHARRNHWNGGLLITVLILLTLTGYGLYYSGIESLRVAASWTHRILGVLLPLIIVLHIWAGRRAIRSAKAASSTPASPSH